MIGIWFARWMDWTSRSIYDLRPADLHCCYTTTRQIQTSMPGSPVAVRPVRAVACLSGRWLSPHLGQHMSLSEVSRCPDVRRNHEPSSYGDRTFAAAWPRLWNPYISYGRFRRQLKGHIFGNDEHSAAVTFDMHIMQRHRKTFHLLTYLLTYLLLLLLVIHSLQRHSKCNSELSRMYKTTNHGRAFMFHWRHVLQHSATLESVNDRLTDWL